MANEREIYGVEVWKVDELERHGWQVSSRGFSGDEWIWLEFDNGLGHAEFSPQSYPTRRDAINSARTRLGLRVLPDWIETENAGG